MHPQIQLSHQQIHNHNHSYFHEAIGGAVAASAAAGGGEPWRVAADGGGAIQAGVQGLLRRRSPVVLPELAAGAAHTVAAADSGASTADREGMLGPGHRRQRLRALHPDVRILRQAAAGAGVL